MTTETDKQIQELLDNSLEIGQKIRGGMSTIRILQRQDTQEIIVLKVMHASFSTNQRHIDRFYHEIKAHKRLNHPNILGVKDHGKLEGQYCLLMQYADRGSLRELLDQVGWLSARVALYIMAMVLEGLEYSHQNNVVHRDIKPSNILLTSNGEVLISDFGISRVEDLTQLTQEGGILGTPAYMSPEQAAGQVADAATDVFAAGIMFYELLTGINPFLADNPGTTLMNIISHEAPPLFDLNPTVSSALEKIIEKLLEKSKDKRYRSCAAALQELLALREREGLQFSQQDFQQYLQTPDQHETSLRVIKALNHLKKGKAYLNDVASRSDLAAVELYKSLFLDPKNEEARSMFDSLCDEKGFHFEEQESEKIKQLEDALHAKPDNVAVLMRLVKLNQIEGNILRAMAYSRRLKKLRPKDEYILSQLQTLLPADDQPEVFDREQLATSKDQDDRSTQATKKSKAEAKTQSGTALEFSDTFQRSISLWSIINFRSFAIITVLLLITATVIILVNSVIQLGENFYFSNLEQTTAADDGPELVPHHAQELGSELFQSAQVALQEGESSKALQLFKNFIEAFPTNSQIPTAYYYLIRIYDSLRDTLRVEDLTNILLIQYPEAPFTQKRLLDRALSLVILGKHQAALWDFEKCYEHYLLLPTPDDKRTFLLNYAQLLYRDQQVDKALDIITEFIADYATADESSEARLLRGQLLLLKDQDAEAATELDHIMETTRPGSKIHSEAAKLRKTIPIQKNLQINP